MRADPEPEITVVHLDGQSAIAQSDADGPVVANLLELQRWMARIALKERIIGVGEFSNRKR